MNIKHCLFITRELNTAPAVETLQRWQYEFLPSLYSCPFAAGFFTTPPNKQRNGFPFPLTRSWPCDASEAE